MLRATLFASLLLLGATPAAARATPPRQAAPHARADAATPVVDAYAAAVTMLLGVAAEREPTWLVTTADGDAHLHMRARRASGPAHRATPAVARAVVARLRERDGGTGLRGVRTKVAADGVLQLVLGELRFEPETSPSFARCRITVVGADGRRETLEFLLKREPSGWRALKMEADDNIARLPDDAADAPVAAVVAGR